MSSHLEWDNVKKNYTITAETTLSGSVIARGILTVTTSTGTTVTPLSHSKLVPSWKRKVSEDGEIVHLTMLFVFTQDGSSAHVDGTCRDGEGGVFQQDQSSDVAGSNGDVEHVFLWGN